MGLGATMTTSSLPIYKTTVARTFGFLRRPQSSHRNRAIELLQQNRYEFNWASLGFAAVA